MRMRFQCQSQNVTLFVTHWKRVGYHIKHGIFNECQSQNTLCKWLWKQNHCGTNTKLSTCHSSIKQNMLKRNQDQLEHIELEHFHPNDANCMCLKNNTLIASLKLSSYGIFWLNITCEKGISILRRKLSVCHNQCLAENPFVAVSANCKIEIIVRWHNFMMHKEWKVYQHQIFRNIAIFTIPSGNALDAVSTLSGHEIVGTRCYSEKYHIWYHINCRIFKHRHL